VTILKKEEFTELILEDYELFASANRCPNQYDLKETCSVDINNMDCEECWRLALQEFK